MNLSDKRALDRNNNRSQESWELEPWETYGWEDSWDNWDDWLPLAVVAVTWTAAAGLVLAWACISLGWR